MSTQHVVCCDQAMEMSSADDGSTSSVALPHISNHVIAASFGALTLDDLVDPVSIVLHHHRKQVGRAQRMTVPGHSVEPN